MDSSCSSSDDDEVNDTQCHQEEDSYLTASTKSNGSSSSGESSCDSDSDVSDNDNESDDDDDRHHRTFNEKSVVHMFLPKQTPDRLQDDLPQTEEDILKQTLYSFQKVMESGNLDQLTPVKVMLKKWKKVQPTLTAREDMVSSLCSALENLDVGHTIPLYIREQNCAMLISKVTADDQEQYRIQTFQASLPSTVIMSSVDTLKMNFPQTSNLIENEEMLCSQIFVSHLYEMATTEFILSKGVIEKAGSIFKDAREVAQPILVSDWAVGVLVPRDDPTSLSISKKIRDQVTMATCKNSSMLIPFRRSGMWMSIKVALHLKILEVFGGEEDTAKLIYKITMLRILVDACQSYAKKKDDLGFDVDLAAQMVAKVGRRVGKLEKLNCGKCDDLISLQVELMRSAVLEYTLEVLTTLNETIQNQWNQIALPSEEEEKEIPINRSTEEFMGDLMHSIDPLDKTLAKARQLFEAPDPDGKMDMESIKNESIKTIKKTRKHRFPTLEAIMNPEIDLWRDKNQLRIWLHDTEHYIKDLQEFEDFEIQDIFELGDHYITIARNEYKDNPLGFSQILLVSLKLASILDKIATEMHPLLLKYRPNIKPSSFDCLLLPHEEDVHLLSELVDYFKERHEKGHWPFLERKIHQNSFSVVYAAQDPEMIELKNQIHADIFTMMQRKNQELEKVRGECRELEQKMVALGGTCYCQYAWKDVRYLDQLRNVFHTQPVWTLILFCDFCKIKAQLAQKQNTVSIYEVPFPPPDQPSSQNAVIFELLIPEEISYLRQFYAVLKYELLGEKIFNGDGNKVARKWLEYSPLLRYGTKRKSKSTNMITMGSTSIPTSSSAQFQSKPDLLTSPNEAYFVNNGMNCQFHFNGRRKSVIDLVEECTFRLSLTAYSEPYLSLQKYMGSTQHFQNDVLANQSDCHQKLSLNEFITFGSLRAGHRIQLRNLYMAIASRSLTIERESVLALVLQTIWQVGPRNEDGVRESHLDFKEDTFALEFLDLLQKLVKSNESNYSIPVVLLTAILITGKIMELNTNCRDMGYQLFKDWRQLTKTWSSKIEDDLKAMDTSNAKTAVNKATMQKILHEIQLCSLMTFNVSGPDQFKNVCKEGQDLAYLLHTLTNKNVLTKESNSHFSGFMYSLKLAERMIPIKLQLDGQFKAGKKVRNRNQDDGLSIFLDEKFSPVRNYKKYDLTKPCDNVIMAQYSTDHCIAMNMVTGELLINGFPETELSSQISGNIQFKRFFRKQGNFRVQRKSANILRTSEPVRGKHYEFRTGTSHGHKPELDIIEFHDNHPALVIVPFQKFQGFISDHFIDNYTHWLDPTKECIYFRRIAAVNDSDVSDHDLPHEYVLTRNGGEDWIFHDEINQQSLLSIKSEGFFLITNALSRLELSRHINVFVNNVDKSVGAHLPRHNLRFILEANGLLESLEYPCFQVSLDQLSVGTFIGLKNGLLMENGAKRNIIIPHGEVKIILGGVQNWKHQVCEIDVDSLSQPSFYIYEFDDVLKRIVAKKSISSWLYLAALHGATSSSQPDPFTGMTGTEMAVNILQSAIVWSCSPYDKESLEILKFIKTLSPKRNYYGHKIPTLEDKEEEKIPAREVIETIEWPEGISTMAAYDGYTIMVNDLVRNSIRLETLHPITEDCKDLYEEFALEDCSEKLLLRAYLRNLDKYNDQARLDEDVITRLDETFEKTEHSVLLRASQAGLNLAPMYITAYICQLDEISLPFLDLPKDSLIPFLFTSQPFISEMECTMEFSLTNLLGLNFRQWWLLYYHLASNPEIADHQQFTLLLSALAYRGAPLEQIKILHSIRTLVESGEVEADFFPPVPEIASVENPTRTFYDEEEIAGILRAYAMPFPMQPTDFNTFDLYALAKRAYDEKVAENCDDLARRWKLLWPCCEISKNEMGIMLDHKIRDTALSFVNTKIRSWYKARTMRFFMEKVQDKLEECLDNISSVSLEMKELDIPVMKTISSQIQPERSEANLVKISGLMDPNQNDYDLVSEAREIYQTGRFEVIHVEGDEGWIGRARTECGRKIEKFEDAIRLSMLKTVNHRILHNSGLSPRLNPINLLRTLLASDFNGNMLRLYAGALGVLWIHAKRLNRCLHFQLHGQQADLEKELQNPGHENWSPMERPEWLLLELELDIMIRQVQVEVAEQMRCMPDEKNGVMQLNMGEGKTSVIVPMLSSILAQEDSLCRVTVLSSIFKMNWSILKFAIGGLLNRRVYSFPCRRDMKMDIECVENIQKTYKECMQMKGVVLTLPEYRLSFRSLSYDKILKEDTELGLKLLETENWLRWHARDILDESDELLSVKYQLVYTIGEQIPVDGGDTRWTMCQQILDFVQEIAPMLLKTHGSSLIEFEEDKKDKAPHEFATVRLLATKENKEFFENLERLVVEKYLALVTLPESQMEMITDFLLKKEISLGSHKKVMTLLAKNSALFSRIMTLAGYIHRGVLSLALSKRWRVEYGVDTKGFRRMAVPFRAKDVAAERTEFGHPDLAIILTHLSYYYSGLSDIEMEEVFAILAGKLGPQAIYNEWIRQIPEDLVPRSLANYHCLNLKDAFQKSTLFDLLKKTKMIVDFWLSHVVFPKESKQFPGKLVMTASDLVYERQRLPITGFSGTNDSIVLLPLTIKQQDLEHLQGTNKRMEQVLLQPENNGHKGFPMGVTCEDILKQMKEDKLRILIDSGALMLELDNEQVAQHWLEIDLEIEAVVYFNKDNELMVKSRSSGLEKSHRTVGLWRRWRQRLHPTSTRKIPDVPFELSPFQGKLGCCGVFLDDQHTRGTDLKFPIGSKACVTIGSRMKREKLLQACMRMRKLGDGHAVTFYLSHEANNKVMGAAGTLSTSSVLKWVKQNTKEFNDDGLLHWALASKNYAQRLAAEDIFHFPNWENPIKIENYDAAKATILAKMCVDHEVTALIDMYGQHCKIEIITELIIQWFSYAKRKLKQRNRPTSLPKEVMARFDEIKDAVWKRCNKYVPDKRLLSSSAVMDEEQEKELELEKEAEVEEERQVERPRRANRANPTLHPNVQQMVTDGEPFRVIEGVLRLSDIFQDTSFAAEVQPDDWSVEVYATNDFISVISPSSLTHFKTNSYLRPMEYFVTMKGKDGAVQILFLSPFEVNKLLPQIRNRLTKCPLRMFATRKFENQDMLLNTPQLQLPPPAIDMESKEWWFIKSGGREMAALLLASGSLYFNNHEEQKSYAMFLNLVAKPWTPNCRKLFDSGMITPSGFLLPEFRERKNSGPRGFHKDPMGLVSKILTCRHPVVSEVAHVVRLLEKKTYIMLRQRRKKEEKKKHSSGSD